MPIDISGEDRVEVVGESFYRAALRQVGTGAVDGELRQRAGLVPEPSNPYDRNAVKVVIDGQQVGHLSRELASLVAAPLAELTRTHGTVEANAELAGFGTEHGAGVVLFLDLTKLSVVVVDEDGELNDSPSSSDGAAGVAARVDVSEGELAERLEVVERAVERWKTELIDLTARNRLLYMRDLPTGTLSLDRAGRDLVMQVVAGKRLLLSKLVPRSLPPDNPQAKLSPFEDAVRRTRAIARTARSYEEERGVRTLFLACGVATWKTDRASRPPAAPVLLVPVDIRARGASQQDFELSVVGDLEVNPTLLHLLKVEFNLEIDEQELIDHVEMDGVIDTPEELRLAFNWLSERCASVAGWAIAERFVLGNFWYAKLPMVRDLEASAESLASHDVAAALAGHEAARQAVIARRQDDDSGERTSHVDTLTPEREFNVLDSDSSQSLAIARALAGENLVLKGPPGTGKSQTIANLIAGAIGNGKRVLFVAEKRAAIEAVTKRLDKVGLGDLVLDLHRGSESRKWLAGQLGISLEATRLAGRFDPGEEDGQLLRAREALAANAEMLHRRHGPWDVSVFDAQIEVLDRGEPSIGARLRGKDLEALTAARLGELADVLRDLISLDGLSLRAKGSPWAEASVPTPQEVELARELVDGLVVLFASFEEELTAAAHSSGLREPATLEEARQCVVVWTSLQARMSTFKPSILVADLDALVETLRPMRGSGLSRFLAKLGSSDYRQALALLEEHLQDGAEEDPPAIYAELLEAQKLKPLWVQIRQGDIEPGVPESLAELAAKVEDAGSKLAALGDVLNRDLGSQLLARQRDEVSALQADYPTLSVLPAIGIARSKFVEAGLDSLLTELEDPQDLLATAEEELYRVWWRSLADHLAMLPENTAALAGFRGERHDQTVATFRERDHRHIELSAQRVLRIAAEAAIRAQDEFPEEAQLVRAQAKRKRGHLPVRTLFSQAPNVVTALRPCWVMSPLMVSQLIPSERAHFDLVVFDEASQVRPVDALSSMIRGKQLVVAGDERQLPPTTFFDATARSDDSEAKDLPEDASEIGDYESVLDVLMTLFATEMLRWHYRSRDERLIGFSNSEIYGGSLTTFPGAIGGSVVEHVLTDELPAEDEARVSPDAEVRRVVDLILDHAGARPEESLGVIALGIRHAEAIEAGLLAVLPEHPELEEFFAEDVEERFFVKNLERVQGDERDAIILAVGYGRTPQGDLPHNFGPLNKAGGERRLNVAVTRAKLRMTVVSSFRAEEIDPTRSSADGVRLLRSYLLYAAAGGSNEASSSRAPEPTALHRSIQEALESVHHPVVVGYGSGSDRIDLAVLDRDTGTPAVAIEIDGLSYAERPSVRDRDRLRPEQLERLGWRHRLTWSQDWIQDPVEAARRLIADVEGGGERAVVSGPDGPVEPSPGHQDTQRERTPRPTFASGGPSITDWSHADLVVMAAWIESDGLLRTSDELQRAMMVELGISRRGSRVARALDEAVAALRRRSA